MGAGCSYRSASDPISRILLFSAVAHFGETPLFQTCVIMKYGRSGSRFDFASSRISSTSGCKIPWSPSDFCCMCGLVVKKAMSR